MMTLHAEVTDNNNDGFQQGDTIEFSGYKWVTKESGDNHTGPGNNYFSGSKDNVYLDPQGKLHLRLTNRNDKWYCPEVRMVKTLGYGRYYFYLEPMQQKLDKDIVVGLFTYDNEDTTNFHKEIDMEFSTWGKDSALNSQYLIQPKETEAHRFQTDFSKYSIHMMELTSDKITLKSFYNTGENGSHPKEISRTKFNPDYKYISASEKICMNVWLYQTIEPDNLKEFEVVISKFEYKPFFFDKLCHKEKKNPEEVK